MWDKGHSAAVWSATAIRLIASAGALALLSSDAQGQSTAGRGDVAVSEAADGNTSNSLVDGLVLQLDATRAELQVLKRELATTRKARDDERARRAMMEQNFALLRTEINALKNDMGGSADAREETLLRELTQAHQELAALRKDQTVSQLQPEAELITRQNQILDEERQRAESLADELTEAEREIERLKSEGAAAGSDEATKRALDQERRKVWLLSHELVDLRRAKDERDAQAMIAEAVQSVAEPDTLRDEAIARDAAQLARERQRADSVERELTAALRERDAMKTELAQVAVANDILERERAKVAELVDKLAIAEQERDAARKEAAQLAALEETLVMEREKTKDIARDLAAAREEIDALKAESKRRMSSIEDMLKRAGAKEKRKTVDKAASKQKLKVAAGTGDRKSARSGNRPRIRLPAVLLPREFAGDGLE